MVKPCRPRSEKANRRPSFQSGTSARLSLPHGSPRSFSSRISPWPSQPQLPQLGDARLQLLDQRDGGPNQRNRVQQLFPSKNARLHDSGRSPCQRLCPRNQRTKSCQQRSPRMARLLSYLAKSSTPSPALLVVRLRLPERHHHVLVVGGGHFHIARVPLAAALRVPCPLALGSAARDLSITNSWVCHELGVTMHAAAEVC